MKLLHRFETNHVDLIHDLTYDYCGKRLATCSSDQTIKIWDQVDNEWKLVRLRFLFCFFLFCFVLVMSTSNPFMCFARVYVACFVLLVSMCVSRLPDDVVEGIFFAFCCARRRFVVARARARADSRSSLSHSRVVHASRARTSHHRRTPVRFGS